MSAKIRAKRGRPRKYCNATCSTGCGAPYEPHKGSQGRCARCSRLDVKPAEPGRFTSDAPRPEEAWDVLGPSPDGEHSDWQIKAAYDRLYVLAPLSALILGRRIKSLEAKMAEIQKLAKS